ncbi:MAG: acylneuraminate cytidylyltransferase [Bacteroidota bacterium]
MSKLVATLACRNNSRRLYAKPLQLMGSESVIEYMIRNLKKHSAIDEIVLAISNLKGNEMYADIAEKHGIQYIFGDDTDVLGRLITACEKGGGDMVFRVTTESPFTYLEGLENALLSHKEKKADYTTIAQLPDGVAFELLSLQALKDSHEKGEARHRSELCSLYLNEHRAGYVFNILDIEKELQRPDYRLTIDYPEDLILCRKIIDHFGDREPISYKDLIQFMDQHPAILSIVNNLTDASYVRFYH